MTDIVKRLRLENMDIVERLRAKTLPQIGGYNGEYTDEDYVFETFVEAADEIERLRKKCDKQAMILRRLNPENFPGIYFICGEGGEKDMNGMPETILVVPSYGSDISYMYTKSDKISSPEW